MAKKKKNKREVLAKARPSRKQYIPFYFMTLFLAFFMIYLDIRGITVDWTAIAGFLVFFFVGLNVTEIHRKNTLFEVTPNSVVCYYDRLLNKNIQKIDYFGISDIYVKNNVWQWLWGYGDINIRLFSKEATIKIKNIDKPEKFAEKIEESMMKLRSPPKDNQENKNKEKE